MEHAEKRVFARGDVGSRVGRRPGTDPFGTKRDDIPQQGRDIDRPAGIDHAAECSLRRVRAETDHKNWGTASFRSSGNRGDFRIRLAGHWGLGVCWEHGAGNRPNRRTSRYLKFTDINYVSVARCRAAWPGQTIDDSVQCADKVPNYHILVKAGSLTSRLSDGDSGISSNLSNFLEN